MIYRFGGIEIDEERREVRRNGKPVAGQAKALDLLLFLVRHRDRPVSRDDLRDLLWPESEVNRGAVNMCVRRARELIRGAAAIRTVAGRRSLQFIASRSPSGHAARRERSATIGRTAERASLAHLVDDLLAGHHRIALLEGPPGIGKTRLLEDLVEQAASRNVATSIVRCEPGAAAFTPWRRIIVAHLGTGARQAVRDAVGAAAADALRDPDDFDLHDAAARLAVVDGVARFLRRAAAVRPLLLVFDDLHAADAASLALLRDVASLIADRAVAIVAAHHGPGPEHPDVLERTLGALIRRGALTIELGPLVESDACGLLDQLSGPSLGGRAARLVLDSAEGNPFLLRELGRTARHARPNGSPSDAAGALDFRTSEPVVAPPPAVDRALAACSESLSPGCRSALGAAAVIGRELDYELLAEVSELDDAILLDAIDEAVWRGLLAPVPSTTDRYRFTRAAFRDSVYRQLETQARIELHRRAAAALERRGTGDDARLLRALSDHFLAVADAADVAVPETRTSPGWSGDPIDVFATETTHQPFGIDVHRQEAEKAIAYTTRAGEAAAAALAYDEAARRFGRAIAALDRHLPSLRNRRSDLLMALANACLQCGDSAAASEAYRRARMGSAARRPTRTRAKNDPSAHMHLVTRFLFALHLEEEPLAGESWIDVRRRREAHAFSALVRARRAGDPAALAAALASRRWIALGPRFVAERLRLSTDLVEAAETIGDMDLVQEARLFRISDLLERGRVAAADRAIDAYARVAESHPEPVYAWVLAFLRATRAQLDGRCAAAETLAAEALQTGATLPRDVARQVFALQLATLRATQGRMAELAGLFEALAAELPDHPTLPIALAGVYCEQGRLDEARKAIASVAADDFAAIESHQETWINCVIGLAQVAASLDDRDMAARMYGRLLPLGETCAISGLACGFLGAVSGYLASFAATMGRAATARRHFEHALDLNARMGAAAHVAHTQFAYGNWLRTQPRADRARAEALLSAAADAARRLELAGLSAALEAI